MSGGWGPLWWLPFIRSGMKDLRIEPQRWICVTLPHNQNDTVQMLWYLLTYWISKFYYSYEETRPWRPSDGDLAMMQQLLDALGYHTYFDLGGGVFGHTILLVVLHNRGHPCTAAMQCRHGPCVSAGPCVSTRPCVSADHVWAHHVWAHHVWAHHVWAHDTVGAQTMCERTMCEPTMCEPTMCEPTMCEPTMCEPTMCEPTMCAGNTLLYY